MGLGVLLFELFTAPMWNSYHLGRFGYYYLDISWIPTLCWTSMFILNVYVIDKIFPQIREWQRFLLSLPIPLIFTVIGEITMVAIGVRTYAPEVIQTSVMLFAGVPVEILYYSPVFSSLIIAFYKFWSFRIEKVPLVPNKKKIALRNFLICFVGVFMFELLIEPLVDNRGFPWWSYLYRDISFFRIGLWVILIGLGTTIVDKLNLEVSQESKFAVYVSIIAVAFFPLESWLIDNGFRVYLQSAVENFTGFTTPVTHIPIEVAFGTIIYLTLIIAFIRYWRIVWDNKL